MRPYLFHIGDAGVPSFFFVIMIGALVTAFTASRIARREGLDPVVPLDMGIIGIIAGVLGSRIFHILVENPAYYWEAPVRVFYFWQGGFVSIGAFIGAIIGLVAYLRIRHLPVMRYLDIIASLIPIVIFSVRLGCLLVGCCYGKPTDFFFHLIFTDPASTAGSLHPGESLHATQVYFMLNAVVMLAFLQWMYRHRAFYGQVMASFFLYYGVTRFFIEFLRGDADRGLYFEDAISTGQISMICFFIVGVVIWKIFSRHRINA